MLLGAVWLLISIKEYFKNIFTQENLLWIIKTTSGPDLPAENLNYTCTKAEPGMLGQFDGWTHEFDLQVTSEWQKGGTEVERYLDDWEGEGCGSDSDAVLAW